MNESFEIVILGLWIIALSWALAAFAGKYAADGLAILRLMLKVVYWKSRNWFFVFQNAYYREICRVKNQRLLELQGLSDGLRSVEFERRRVCDCGHQVRLHENAGCVVETCSCKRSTWDFLIVGQG